MSVGFGDFGCTLKLRRYYLCDITASSTIEMCCIPVPYKFLILIYSIRPVGPAIAARRPNKPTDIMQWSNTFYFLWWHSIAVIESHLKPQQQHTFIVENNAAIWPMTNCTHACSKPFMTQMHKVLYNLAQWWKHTFENEQQFYCSISSSLALKKNWFTKREHSLTRYWLSVNWHKVTSNKKDVLSQGNGAMPLYT